jgi:hypothetical protein
MEPGHSHAVTAPRWLTLRPCEKECAAQGHEDRLLCSSAHSRRNRDKLLCGGVFAPWKHCKTSICHLRGRPSHSSATTYHLESPPRGTHYGSSASYITANLLIHADLPQSLPSLSLEYIETPSRPLGLSFILAALYSIASFK